MSSAYLWTMTALMALRVLALLARRPGEFWTFTPGELFSARLLAIALLIWSAVLLAACGGGDADAEDRSATAQPVNCKLTPEICK